MMVDPNGIEGLDAEFIGRVSPTAPRIQAGGHPCQGIYWTEAGKRPKVAIIATHYNVDFSEHYIAPYFAERGIGFLSLHNRERRYSDQVAPAVRSVECGLYVAQVLLDRMARQWIAGISARLFQSRFHKLVEG